MTCEWCLHNNVEMSCHHQCVICFGNGFRTQCNCTESQINQGLDSFDRRDK